MTDPNILKLKLNIETAMANSLRRTMISEIPSIVIQGGKFDENDSSIIEEIITSRLGLIPLRKTNNTSEVEFSVSINEEGPKTVYSRDIKFPDGIEVVDPNIKIVKLNKGDILKFEGFTAEGIQKKHAKFQVCHISRYEKVDNNYYIDIESFGNYTAKEIFTKALDILKENLLFYKNIK